ncbi:protein inturned-like [Mya arenaria]|uniref:protein inturned-like n=1 Tax=Mya arenaria TaxID=6604 RepID=UPI0022E4B67C|nr:protein inturned-like [Mya arenaria]
MAYFPRFAPFYEPHNEHQFYGEDDGQIRLRNNESGQDNVNTNVHRYSDGWANVVQSSGNLFYSENSERPHSYSRQDESAYHSRQASYQSSGSHQSSSSDSPRQQLHRRNSRESNASQKSYSGSQNSTAQDKSSGHVTSDNYSDHHFQRDITLRQSDQSYTGFSKNLNNNVDQRPTRSSQRNNHHHRQTSVHSVNGSNSPIYSQSGKRKSVLMVANLRHISDVRKAQGVELCERLFGIKLCHHKQKPPRPNGASVDPALRDRKIIVQGVVQDSEADICGQINRGDMLVGLNDCDLTWLNIDEMLRQAAQSLQKVKLTFQMPVVVGPKAATPPLTPTRHTPPPLPPHIPLHPRLTPPPRPPPPPIPSCGVRPDLITMTTGESPSTIREIVGRYLVAVMYLTFAGQSENSKDDVIYQFPVTDNKLIDVRGIFLTLGNMLPDITSNTPKLTTLTYRGHNSHVVYWKEDQDVLLLALPEQQVPPFYLLHIFSDLLHVINVLYGSVQRVFRDHELHSCLDELVLLTLHRTLQSGVNPGAIPHPSPLEPRLLDTLTGVRGLQLTPDDKISCDEILNEFEAQDFSDCDVIDRDERRKYGIVGSCLFYRDYLLCSHLCPGDLRDVALYLRYHGLLKLAAGSPDGEVCMWSEIYPTRLCHQPHPDNPGYREPQARWYLLVVNMRQFQLCTVLEAGSYSKPVTVKPQVDQFLLEQSKETLSQLDLDDTDIEVQCNDRLFSDTSGPTLKSIDSEKPSQTDVVSPLKSTPSPRKVTEDDRLSLPTPNGHPLIRRQGSKLSYGSNDSSGSTNSLNKIRSPMKKGSVLDVDPINRSFSRDSSKTHCDIKLTRGLHNQLLHYVNFDAFEGVYLCPTPSDLATLHSPTHQHVLYNFYACCLRLHQSFVTQVSKTSRRVGVPGENGMRTLEEGVMFTCQLPQGPDPKKLAPVIMYWTIGRRFPDGHEMFVCLEDGSPQSLLELAFTYNFGLT